MNKGIRNSQGEWLYFMGGDDYLFSSDVLQALAQKLKKNKESCSLRQCVDKRRYWLGY